MFLREVKDSRSHVPWMHVFEWQQVCCDVFSIELEERCRGYEKLLLWKARQREIPPGIECTLELVYVDLLDKNALANIINAGAFGEHEMQVLMSSAIMRFLTHLGVLVGREKSFQEMATSLNLPYWLVQLRHDAAHQKDLPPLLILRRGVKFCLEWLLKNYWQEANKSSKLIITHLHPGNFDVYELLEAWESVNLYMLRGFSTIAEIDSVFLLRFLHRVKASQKPELDFVCRTVLKKLFHAIRNNWCLNGEQINEKLIPLVLQCKTFIPTSELLEMMKTPGYFHMSDERNVVNQLVEGWKLVLGPLQEDYSLLPSLIHKLVLRQVALGNKNSSQQLIISQWINVLCRSIIKSRAVAKVYRRDPIKKRELKKGETMKEVEEREYMILAEQFDKLNPEWRGGFLAVPQRKGGNYCPRSLAEMACLSANEFTPIFLPSLLMVAKPTLSHSTKSLIEELVLVYTSPKGTNKSLLPSDRVHTVQELPVIGEFPKFPQSYNESNEQYELKQCELGTSMYQWSICPLGSLPWNNLTLPSLDFPESVKWIDHTVDSNCTFLETDTRLVYKSFKNNKVNREPIENERKRSYIAKHTKKQKLMAVNAGVERDAGSNLLGKRGNKFKRLKRSR